MQKLTLLMLFLVISAPCRANTIKVYNLGVLGKTTPVDMHRIIKINEVYLNAHNTKPDYHKLKQTLEKVKPFRLSFRTEIKKHSGKPTRKVKRLERKVPLPAGTTMLFFTCADIIPQQSLKKISYAYCLGYKSLQEIEEFREGNKAKFPVQPLLTDKICKWLGISSLPAMVTIKGATLEIQEGF